MSDETITSGPQTLPVAAPPRPKPPLVAGGRPQAIVPQDIDQIWRLAGIICEAGMTPKDFKTPAQVTIAIMHGLEIGLNPMQALQKIAVINNRPAVWGDAVIGLVQARGVDEYIVEEFTGTLQDGTLTAICRTKRKGRPNEVVRKFSVAQAKRARLWDERQKVSRYRNNERVEVLNDSPWYRFPERMLQMRARGLCLRDVYADVLGGLYLAEELIEPGDDAIDVTPAEAQPVRKAPPPPASVIEGSAQAAVTHTNVAAGINGVAATGTAGEMPDIPANLRRVAEDNEVDEDEWLNSLDNAYGACEDRASLDHAVVKYADPMMEKASDAAWDAAKRVYDKHHQRIVAQA